MSQITLNAWGYLATIDYPDGMDTLIPGAFGAAYGYEEMVVDENEDDIPNPQSLEEFTIARIFDYVGDIMRSHGVRALMEDARIAAEAEVATSMDQISVNIADEE